MARGTLRVMSGGGRELGALRNLRDEIDDLVRALELRGADSAGAERDESTTATHLVRMKVLAATGRWRAVLLDVYPELGRTYDRAISEG